MNNMTQHPKYSHWTPIILCGLLIVSIITCIGVSAAMLLNRAKYNASVAELQKSVADLSAELYNAQRSLQIYDEGWTVGNPTPPRYFDVALDEDLQSYIYSLCVNYNIADKYELVYAVIRQESNFNPDSISASDDYGLMQINIINHEYLSALLGITDFLDPYQNVHAGIYILSSLLQKYDTADALMAYNMGTGGAGRLWRRGIHSTKYSEQVLDYYTQFIENI